VTPADAIALYREARDRQRTQLAPVLAAVKHTLEQPTTGQFRHRSTAGRGVACACPPEKEHTLREAAKVAPSMNGLARAMGWSPRTAAKHCERLGITLGQ